MILMLIIYDESDQLAIHVFFFSSPMHDGD